MKKGIVLVKWRELVCSEERHKKVGYEREFGIHDVELHKEVYTDYISQLPLSEERNEANQRFL